MKKPILYMLAFLAVQFVAQFLVVAIYSLVNGQVSDDLPPMWDIATMVLFSVVSIVLFLKMCWAEASRSYLQSRPWDVLLWSVVASLGAIVPSLLLQGLIPEWTGWAKDIVDQTNQQLEGLMSIPGGYMVIALLPPVVEELVFRGAVLRSLLEWKPEKKWAMIALSALFFSLVHLNPAQMPHAFLIGLLLGWMYTRTGSIVPGVAYHWANNTAAYVMFHLYHNPESLQDIVGPGMRPAMLALLFSLCILIPSIFQLNLRMKKPS
ncbi:MAG: CPBP family intramembrane metalloprotease [Prevotella sp.]|nr:CPBP family intramembrane metalloprotease [Prevotella sp.]